MKTDTDVGYYNAAVKIKSVLVSLVTSLGTVLMPRTSYYVEHGQMEEFRNVTKKALNFEFLAAAPLMVYFIMFASQSIYFLSGPAYTEAIIPMKIIMPTILFIGITNILGIQVLVPLGKEKIVLYSEIAGAVVDLILNAILIPRFASSGAAIGTLAAEITVFIVQFMVLRSDMASAFRAIAYWKIVLGIILGSMASYWLVSFEFGNFITLLISAVLFFGVYGIVLLVAREKFTVEIANQFLERFRKLHK